MASRISFLPSHTDKMESLRQAYPYTSEIILKTALVEGKGDPWEALQILQVSVGQPTPGTSKQPALDSDSLSEEDLYWDQRWYFMEPLTPDTPLPLYDKGKGVDGVRIEAHT
jgi:hypothetical protein